MIHSPIHLIKQASDRIRSDEQLNRIVYNTSWLFADRIIRMGLGVIIVIFLARYLGPEQFGIYNYAIAFVALFTAFSSLGLDSIVVRDIVRSPEKKDEILGTSLVLKLHRKYCNFRADYINNIYPTSR
jgi:polysaccharide transporter, PST family